MKCLRSLHPNAQLYSHTFLHTRPVLFMDRLLVNWNGSISCSHHKKQTLKQTQTFWPLHTVWGYTDCPVQSVHITKTSGVSAQTPSLKRQTVCTLVFYQNNVTWRHTCALLVTSSARLSHTDLVCDFSYLEFSGLLWLSSYLVDQMTELLWRVGVWMFRLFVR